MDTKVGLGGNPKSLTNGPIILRGISWKKPFNLSNLILKKIELYHGSHKKDILTALYPNMSEFMIHKKIQRQFVGHLGHSVKSRTTEQSSAEDIIDLLEEVTTRARIGSSRVNLKTRFNTPWKNSVHKNPEENVNSMKYKSAYIIRKCRICQSTIHLANLCPRKGKINEIDIENKPDVEKDGEVIQENSDDKSSVFSEYSKYIENKNSTF
ncbi:hypothetical protein O181_081560 [Austropuccinia psidii MF-1]|uniref:Uncharacterized protein n=1 Tax=Austropuccinia psidii MF-1 TaxID=1389203 RepID=A0A9Q3FJ86_9BASI|nr:hypothetical protein [Austropuccinia psidii MF-1]